jgi:putative membrane protein
MDLLFLLYNLSAQWGGYGRDMGPGMMGWGYGIGWFGGIISIVFWIAVIVGIFFLIRWMTMSMKQGGRESKSEDSAIEILKKRYAQGEINKEEFEEKRRDLEK